MFCNEEKYNSVVVFVIELEQGFVHVIINCTLSYYSLVSIFF